MISKKYRKEFNMERRIGEVFYDERLKKQIKCIACEPGICDPCIYHAHILGEDYCSASGCAGRCHMSQRRDKTSVVFREVKKEEPFELGKPLTRRQAQRLYIVAHGLPKTMPYDATLMHCIQTYGCTLDIFRRMSNKLLALLANALEEMEGEDAAE